MTDRRPGRENTMTVMQYNAEIIGAGQAGVPLATTLAQAGYRTMLVEREHLGGTCPGMDQVLRAGGRSSAGRIGPLSMPVAGADALTTG
jgi:heterodisulfide reductase subunit A-like polyferredoxin